MSREYEIVRFRFKGGSEVIKTMTCTEEEAQAEVEKYPSVRGKSFVGYRSVRTEAEVAEDAERTIKRIKALRKISPSFKTSRRA